MTKEELNRAGWLSITAAALLTLIAGFFAMTWWGISLRMVFPMMGTDIVEANFFLIVAYIILFIYRSSMV